MALNNTTILIVEDEPAIVQLISYSLKDGGWHTESVSTAADAWQFLQERTPQLMLLDWMLPDQSGLRLLGRIRGDRQFNPLPIIMLTAKGMEEDKIAGLNNGADDYVTKPFSPLELNARVRALLRRKSPEHSQEVFTAGPITLDPVSCSVALREQRIENGFFRAINCSIKYGAIMWKLRSAPWMCMCCACARH
jgi:two-component system, OmpR family, phosphate regulon response regulator PhoB